MVGHTRAHLAYVVVWWCANEGSMRQCTMMLEIAVLLDIPCVPGLVAVLANRDSERVSLVAPIRIITIQLVLM